MALEDIPFVRRITSTDRRYNPYAIERADIVLKSGKRITGYVYGKFENGGFTELLMGSSVHADGKIAETIKSRIFLAQIKEYTPSPID